MAPGDGCWFSFPAQARWFWHLRQVVRARLVRKLSFRARSLRFSFNHVNACMVVIRRWFASYSRRFLPKAPILPETVAAFFQPCPKMLGFMHAILRNGPNYRVLVARARSGNRPICETICGRGGRRGRFRVYDQNGLSNSDSSRLLFWVFVQNEFFGGHGGFAFIACAFSTCSHIKSVVECCFGRLFRSTFWWKTNDLRAL